MSAPSKRFPSKTTYYERNQSINAGQLPDTSEELLKLDQVFIKSELKVGVIYVKEGNLKYFLFYYIFQCFFTFKY